MQSLIRPDSLNLTHRKQVMSGYLSGESFHHGGIAAIRQSLYNAGSVKILLLGDSTMYGAWVPNLNLQSPNHPGVSLQAALSYCYRQASIVVDNQGISGQSLHQLMIGEKPGNLPSPSAEEIFSTTDADVVICNHGMNDFQSNTPIPMFEEDLKQYMELANKYKKLIVYATPNQVFPDNYGVDGTLEKTAKLPAYVEVVRSVCREYGVPLVDQYYYFSQTFKNVNPTQAIGDGVHPTDRGYEQAGFNLAIPFIGCNTLEVAGDAQPAYGCSLGANAQISHAKIGNAKYGQITNVSGIPGLMVLSIPFIYDATVDVAAVHPLVDNAKTLGFTLNRTGMNGSQPPGIANKSIGTQLVSSVTPLIPASSMFCGLQVLTVFVPDSTGYLSFEGVTLQAAKSTHTRPYTDNSGSSTPLLMEMYSTCAGYTTSVAFSGIMSANSGVRLYEVDAIGSVGFGTRQFGITLGLDSEGKLSAGIVNENGAIVQHRLNETVYAGAVHNFAFVVTSTDDPVILAVVDGVRVGLLSTGVSGVTKVRIKSGLSALYGNISVTGCGIGSV